MVVSNWDGDGTGDDGSLADFAWRDNGIVGRADGDDGIVPAADAAPLGRMCMCLREILFRGLALQLIEPIDKIRSRLVIASEKQEDARTA